MEKVNEKTRKNLKTSRDENKSDQEFPPPKGMHKQAKPITKNKKAKSHKAIQ
ncbi:hypothetical protein [Nitrosopumilus ureiphilus]|uniref:hypothetical protein n=1 Tax=Nitrosopumilus ureiphilus TaxID=1470067 RepID=UPI0015C77D09|nr:hypothetical protein [Nitrosopumilus ureiphilus]